MAKEEQAPDEVEAEGGGKKKMILIIGVAVAVALILGVVAFMVLGKSDKKTKKEGDAAQTEGKPAEAGAHGAPAAAPAGAPAPAAGAHGGAPAAGAAAGPSANIFPLEPFIVNIYDGQELRYLKMKIELEMAIPAVKAELEARLAPIRDAILVLLSAKTLQDIQDVQGKNTLKEEILGAINKHIPPGKIAKIYFTDFVVQ